MTTLLLISIVLAIATAAHAARPLPERIARTITATWTCQEAIGVPRTKSGNVWARHSVGYRRWQLALWTGRLNGCLHYKELYEDVAVQVESGLSTFYRQAGAGNTGPMSGTGKTLERIGRKHRISPFFIAAVAMTESSAGLAACRNNHRNVWGLSSCTSGWYVPTWSSWAQAYDFYARFLTSRWPHARTTFDYHGYAANSYAWGVKTASHMRARFGVGPEVRYP